MFSVWTRRSFRTSSSGRAKSTYYDAMRRYISETQACNTKSSVDVLDQRMNKTFLDTLSKFGWLNASTAQRWLRSRLV